MKVYDSAFELIGNTPLISLGKIKKAYDLKCDIYAKLESKNPAGSIKDRVAFSMIESAEKEGKISDGATIIEPTSGNTGIGVAMISAIKGYNAVIVMPDNVSKERISLIKAYGGKVVLTDKILGMQGAVDRAREIEKSTKNSIILSQFDNPANPSAHTVTAMEIERDLDGKMDFFVAGVGTGGTLCGCAKYFKEKKIAVKIIGVEPESSPLITKGYAGTHKIQGIGSNFIPKNYDGSLVDEVLTASYEKAVFFANEVAKKEGILVGISSGASLSVAIDIAKKEENKGKKLVVIFPDSGERYLSTGIFD